MENAKISVIVPVYNVENYFSRCLDSLKKQAYSNAEFILVDDGSPDNSAVMCEEIALEDDRFCVIHKGNGGLSHARNVGISVSSGDYLSFVDSDDFLINQPLEFGAKILETENADVFSASGIHFLSNSTSVSIL